MMNTKKINAVFLVLMLSGMCAGAQQAVKPLAGFAVGPRMDEILPKRFIVDAPTIENLGFRWYVEGLATCSTVLMAVLTMGAVTGHAFTLYDKDGINATLDSTITYGIMADRKDIPAMVEHALQDFANGANPVLFSRNDFEQIYQ